MKIQTQTALLFTILAAAVILLLNAVIYYAATRDTADDFKKRLELRTIVAAKINFEKDTSSSAAYNEIREQYLEILPGEREYMFRAIADTHQLGHMPPVPASYLQEIKQANGGTVYYRQGDIYFAGILYHTGNDTYYIIKSAVNLYGLQALKNLKRILLIAFIGKVVLVFTVGIYFSRKAFKPFRGVIARVKNIGVENLSLRLTEKKGRDEIAELSRTFNGMLDRLQTAFDIQNNFVSSASHELKTPLTAIIGEAEIVLSKERDAGTYKQTLEVILKEAEKLEAMTTALLSLAQSGFNNNRENYEPVRLDELLYEIGETIQRINPESKLKLEMQELPASMEGLVVMGNPQLLKLAISNVIMNACKYSSNQPVGIKISSNQQQLRLDVSDSGIGIPDAELKHVFVPFFRASNTGPYKGYGVGLPLALNIIRQHHGNISVASDEGKGTRVTILLPLAES